MEIMNYLQFTDINIYWHRLFEISCILIKETYLLTNK